jgi:hypothetical protein
MDLKPSWVIKTDPKKHPVRFLAGLWRQRMKERFGVHQAEFTPQQYGQLKCLRKHLGDITCDAVEWIVEPVNWWYFCQQVRAELKINLLLPDYPHVGFLLGHRGSALRAMRSKLGYSSAGAELIKKLDQKDYEQARALALVYADGTAERLAKIAEAKTLNDMRKVLNELMQVSAA